MRIVSAKWQNIYFYNTNRYFGRINMILVENPAKNILIAAEI